MRHMSHPLPMLIDRLVLMRRLMRIAVGTHIAIHNPHKAVSVAFPHTASTLGI